MGASHIFRPGTRFLPGLKRAQHAVPLRLIGAMDMKDRAEGTPGRRAANSNSRRSEQRPYEIGRWGRLKSGVGWLRISGRSM